MAAVIPTPNPAFGTYDFTLTDTNSTCDLELKDFIASAIEYLIKADATFSGGTLKVYRFISPYTGWVPYVMPLTTTPIAIPGAGAGYGLQFLHRAGKIRFSLEGASAGAAVPISIFR